MSISFLDVAILFEAFTDPFGFIALIGILALGLGLIRKSYGFSFFITLTATFAITHALKSIFKVARPEDALVESVGYRFPSMHAAIAGAFAASFAWHLATRAKHPALKIAVIALFALPVAIIAATRIFLGVHETLDVIVGALLGIGIGFLVHAAMRRAGLE